MNDGHCHTAEYYEGRRKGLQWGLERARMVAEEHLKRAIEGIAKAIKDGDEWERSRAATRSIALLHLKEALRELADEHAPKVVRR